MTASDSVADKKLNRRRLVLYHIPYVVLYAVAVGLVAMTSHNAAGTSIYWQMFIGLIALVSIVAGWRFASEPGSSVGLYMLKQVLHWGALVLVIRLLYTHNLQDFLNDNQDGFVTVYMIALTAILSGIYMDWRMALFGIFLLLSGVGMAWIDNNAMLISVIAAAAALGVVVTLLIRHRGKPELSSD